jgi:hypothetical protein
MGRGDCVSTAGRSLHHVGRHFAARLASCAMDTEGSFPGVKRPGREAKCLRSFSALAQKRCVAPVLRTTAVATWTGTAPLAGARPDPRDLCLCVFVFMSN